MSHSLGMNYSQMGLVGTGNFVGYMLSVVLAGVVAKAIGARKTIVIGLLLVGGSMILIGQARNFLEVLSFYVATGIGSGLANIPMLGLVSHWFTRSNRGKAAGIILSGNGVAIVFAGLFVPWVNSSSGADGWRTSWLTIGVLSLAVAVVAAIFLRNEPEEKGLMALGQTQPLSKSSEQGSEIERECKNRTMVHLGLIYALFGATYAVYATFIVVTLVDDRGFGENTAGMFWAVVGAVSIFSGPLFGALSDRLGRKTGMILVNLLFTVSFALVAMDLTNQALYVSIGIFGLTVWSIPTIMSATVGDYAGPAQAVQTLGFITLFFGFGQIAGPAVAGFIADTTGNFNFAFWLCAALSALAVLLSYFLRPPAAFVVDPDGRMIE
jgi:MFS family permease